MTLQNDIVVWLMRNSNENRGRTVNEIREGINATQETDIGYASIFRVLSRNNILGLREMPNKRYGDGRPANQYYITTVSVSEDMQKAANPKPTEEVIDLAPRIPNNSTEFDWMTIPAVQRIHKATRADLMDNLSKTPEWGRIDRGMQLLAERIKNREIDSIIAICVTIAHIADELRPE